MRGRVIKNLYKKEMLDVLRDKKTVLMMLVVPLVLYPLLFIFGMQLMVRVSTGMAEHTYKVAIETEDQELLEGLLLDAAEDGDSFAIIEVSDATQALATETVDAYITSETVDGRTTYQIHYLSAVTNSSYAMELLVHMFQKYSGTLTVERIKEAGLDPQEILEPIGISAVDRASKEASAGSILGMILPFMLVVSLLLGTMYPAIDTTAGERERGTLETVLTLPVSNNELIFSKFLTVATIGVVSAFLNILAMCGVGVYMYNMATNVSDNVTKLHMEKFVPAILIGVLCVFAFAVFISAISMCFSAFAKSYKEANNYMTPLMLIVMFASFVSFLPNVTLSNNMALIPVANICLLIRDLLAFKMNIGITALVLFSNIIYGIVTIMILGKIYSSETILFGDGMTGVQIFERRSNMKKGGVPTVGDMWLVIAIVAVAILYIGGGVAVKDSFLSVVVTQLFIAGIPLFVVWYSKRDFVKTFRIRGSKISMFFGGILLILGALCLGMILTAIVSAIFPSSASQVEESMVTLDTGGLPSTLFLVALLPAVCEELMFRGFIFSALSARMKASAAIAFSAAIFGVYHMSVVRFFTTALLGAAICYVAHKSGSIFPGMLMHAINNSLAVLASFYPGWMEKYIPILTQETFEVMDIIMLAVVGVALAVAGIIIVRKGNKLTYE